jgi:hypothetical protein
MPKKEKAPKAPKMGRGGVPCCARGGPAPIRASGGLAPAKKNVFQPVMVEKKFFGGLTKALKKANESVMTGMVEHAVGSAIGKKKGGMIPKPSIF